MISNYYTGLLGKTDLISMQNTHVNLMKLPSLNKVFLSCAILSYPTIHPSTNPPFRLSVHYSFVLLSIHLSIRPFTHLFILSLSVRRCSSLEAPQFGFIYPYMCTSFPVSGTVCYLECGNGFIGNGGVDEIRCGENGKWSSNNSLILQCLGTIFSFSFLRPRCSVSHVWCKRVLPTYTE